MYASYKHRRNNIFYTVKLKCFFWHAVKTIYLNWGQPLLEATQYASCFHPLFTVHYK